MEDEDIPCEFIAEPSIASKTHWNTESPKSGFDLLSENKGHIKSNDYPCFLKELRKLFKQKRKRSRRPTKHMSNNDVKVPKVNHIRFNRSNKREGRASFSNHLSTFGKQHYVKISTPSHKGTSVERNKLKIPNVKFCSRSLANSRSPQRNLSSQKGSFT